MEFRLLVPEESAGGRETRFAASVVTHALVVAALILVPWAAQEHRVTTPRRMHHVMLSAPDLKVKRKLTMRPVRSMVTKAAAVLPQLPELLPAVVKPRQLLAEPVVTIAPALVVAAPEMKFAETKPVEVAKLPVAVAPVAVKTGTFESASAPDVRTRALATVSAGFGDAAVNRGQARAMAASVSSGFGDAAAVAAAGIARNVASGGFDTAKAEPARAVARAVIADAGFMPVEILEKPQPVYSEEARRLRVEGSIQVRVVFGANGEIRVLGIVRSLGHGLDEAATAAAARIRFRPARRAGQAVDATALVQIVFQLA